MNNKDIFAANFNRLMAAQGKTRRDISDALGVSYYTVTSWANGSKHPRMTTLEALATYLGVKMADLIESQECSKDEAVDSNATHRYLEQVRTWNSEFGVDAFSEDELHQLYQYARFLMWQRQNN